MKPQTAHIASNLLVALALFLGGGTASRAAIWNDSAGNDNWSDDGNWNPSAPGSSGTAEFDGTGASPATVDSAHSVNSILFNNGSDFTIGGTAKLSLGTGGIDVQDTSNYAVSAPVEITGNQDWNVAESGTLTVNYASKTTGRKGVTKTGAGTLTLTEYPTDGTNGAEFDVEEGTVNLDKAGRNFKITNVGGAGTPARVEWINGGFIDFPTIKQDGTVDIGSQNPRLGGTTFEGGGTLEIDAGGSYYANGSSSTIGYTPVSGGEQATIEGDGVVDMRAGVSYRGFGIDDDASLDVEMRVYSKVTMSENDLSLQKDGAGTVAFEGANDYTTDTLVNSGGLLINGTTTGQGRYTVDGGATLGGTGTIGLASGETVTVNGALAPGESIGTLGVNGDVVFGPGTLVVDVDDQGNSDLLEITGDLDLGDAGDAIQVNGTPAYDPRVWYTLVTYTGNLTGEFNGLDLPSRYSIRYEDGEILLVPEPASFVVLLLAGAALLRRRTQ